jgi:arylsulfatase A-like enzyme
LDTFRADRVGALGNPNGLTPNIDAFAAESIVFERAWSQAVQTAPSHTSLFTSRYPTEQVGGDEHPFVPPEMPLLPQLLSLYGYQTGAFVGGGDLSRHRGLSPGFEVYESSVNFGSLWHTGPMALGWLQTVDRERPWFLFVHGYDTHSRYIKPTPYGYTYADARATGVGQYAVRTASERIVDGTFYPDFNALMASFRSELHPRSPEARARFAAINQVGLEHLALKEEDAELIRDVYDGAVSYADTMFGLFMASLQDQGVLDEAVIVLLSDHGEQLGEHGLFGHCCEANDEETHVPLIVRLPRGEGGGRRVTGIVELVDVMPTLLEIAGATPPARMQGRSFGAALRGEPFEGRKVAFTQGSEMMRIATARSAAGRLTWSGLSASSPYAADLVAAARVTGPSFVGSETLDVAAREEIRGEMVTWMRGLAPPPGGQHGELPDALKKSLREHGYWNVAP